ncbi:MAG: hypothetical protein JW934_15160, partial [Anaerolineae bacterium]|nr:hypothetical protein [Anaerolineae bacterium]
VAPDELRRAQDELKVILDAPRGPETANALAEQIQRQMAEWGDRAERVILQLRPARYPIPEALGGGHELVRQVTRFQNPGKVVKAFLDNLEAVRRWHAQAQTLYQFVVLDGRLPVYQTARQLLDRLARAVQSPDLAAQFDAETLARRDALVKMIADGQVAEAWDRFQTAYEPLRDRFRQVYEDWHTRRAEALAAAQADLHAAGLDAAALNPYCCPGLRWTADSLACGECHAELHELPTHLVAIPALTRQQLVREQAQPVRHAEAGGKRVVSVPLAAVLGGREIEDEAGRDAALDALRQTIDDALQDADVVRLA